MESWFNDYIKGLSSAEYHYQVTVLFIILCYLIYKIVQTHHRYRFINDTATSKIVSAAQGYVELKGLGEMMPGMNIKSPFSGRSCLWYQCKVEKKDRTGKFKTWSEQSTDLSEDIFYLQDDTALCVIIPEGAYVIPSEELYWYGSSYQSKYQGVVKSWWFNRYFGFGKFRFSEKLILAADPLYVTGLFNSVFKNRELETLQHDVNELVDKWKKQPVKYLKMFDLDNNGKIQKQEWKKIRQFAEQKIANRKQEFLYNTVQKPEERGHPFIISAVSEERLLKIKYKHLSLYVVLFSMLLFLFITAIRLQ